MGTIITYVCASGGKKTKLVPLHPGEAVGSGGLEPDHTELSPALPQTSPLAGGV